MKKNRSVINVLVGCGVALALVSTLAAQTPIDGKATVIRMKGAARYVVGKTGWKPLHLGQVLYPGTVVQTDMNVGSYVDLVLSEENVTLPGTSQAAPTTPVGFEVPTEIVRGRPATAQNVVRVWENTVLGVDKLTALRTGADVVTETQLDLKAGHITAVVKKMSAASRYEVKIPDGVAGIRGTVVDLWANGDSKCSEGSVILVRTKKQPGETAATPAPSAETTTVVLNSGQAYDSTTGQTTTMSDAEINALNSVVGAASVPTTGGLSVNTSASDLTVIHTVSGN